MASQSSIAEGEKSGISVSDQLQYRQSLFSHPQYRLEAQFSNTYGAPIILGTSQVSATINLPPVPFNLAQSYLLYSVNIPVCSTANSYIWYATQALAHISHIQFY